MAVTDYYIGSNHTRSIAFPRSLYIMSGMAIVGTVKWDFIYRCQLLGVDVMSAYCFLHYTPVNNFLIFLDVDLAFIS